MAVWRELVFLVPAPQVERWSDALLDAGALSVQAEDADADSPDERALFGEPGMPVEQAGWQRTRLRALLAESATPLTPDPSFKPLFESGDARHHSTPRRADHSRYFMQQG